ncbi:MAG: nitroreductase family protein [Acidimicrobiales bacterium]
MELTDAVRRRRMTRNFSGRPLDPGVVDDLLEAALRAPSAGNTQGREFVVLQGEETARYWDTTTDSEWRARSSRFAGLRRAPVVVLAFADPDAYADRYQEPDKVGGGQGASEWGVPFWFVDAGFSVMIILLGAADQGVGAAFLGNFRGEAALAAELGVPDRLRWLGAVLLGEAADPDPPTKSGLRTRRTLEECVHRGGWKAKGGGSP